MSALIKPPPSISSQRGVSSIEMALVLPIVFLVFFGTVGLSWTIFQHYMIQRAHYSAARGGSIQDSSCKAAAASRMQTALNAVSIPFNPATDVVSSGPVVANGIPGFHMNVSINLRCIACGLPGMGSLASYNSDVFYPFMTFTSCFSEPDS